MAEFDTALDAALRASLRIMGEDAVFLPAGGLPITGIKIWIDRELILQQQGYEAQVYSQADTVEALLADIGREPDEGEAFEALGHIYTVVRPLENDGVSCKCQVKRT